MDTFIEKVPDWLRWALIPVASALTFAFALVVGNIAAKLVAFMGGERGMSENFLTYLVVPGVATFIAVQVAAVLAPRAKQKSAVVIAALWTVLCGFAVFFTVIAGEFKFLMPSISMVVGCAYAAIAAAEHDR